MDFDDLLPDLIFSTVEQQGLRPTGALTPLNSYENRVYEIGIENGEPFIAKFYRPNRWSYEQIAEEHLFVACLKEAEVPCVAHLPLKAFHGPQQTIGKVAGYFYAYFPKFRGREEPDINNEHREWLGRTLGRLHNISEHFPAKYRIQLDPETYGYEALEQILNHNYAPEDVRPALEDVIQHALALVEEHYRPGIKLMPIHGDCHLGNVLWNREGPFLVDFDDMVFAPPVQDVWMLFNGDKNEVREQKEAFFKGYETFRKFEHASFALTECLRTLRMIHFSAWIGRRFEEPAFQRAFPYYRDIRYWEQLLLGLKEQIALMQE